MLAVPWDRRYGDAIRQELFGCYSNEDWFSNVGTQFDKRIISKEATCAELGLTKEKKIAVIFPHILWDGSFFYGEDLFQNYTEWLIETIKAARKNDRIQWVVKVHPAHTTKARQEHWTDKPAELLALEKMTNALPPHITLVMPEAKVSTYSLFQIADYVVTVRGTVGIEAPLFGIPVITAGTGRYDRRGFTVDSSTREEYLARLANLENLPPLTREQIELAERYAFNVFLCRPLRLASMSLEFARDGKSTPVVKVHRHSREEWLSSPDMVRLSNWFRDGATEDFTGVPFDAVAAEIMAIPSQPVQRQVA